MTEITNRQIIDTLKPIVDYCQASHDVDKSIDSRISKLAPLIKENSFDIAELCKHVIAQNEQINYLKKRLDDFGDQLEYV